MGDRLFGTDGIRGLANSEPITAHTALAVAQAAGVVFRRGDHRHTAVVGKDTRLSGYLLESALIAGFTSVGMDVVLLGPIPTPAVGMLTRSLRADLGVMISASHNPYQDNGIKLFGPDGFKLSDEVEAEIESLVETHRDIELAARDEIGQARRMEDSQGRYIEFVKSSFSRRLSLEGLKIVVDCANGAAYKSAPIVLYELGADVIPLGVKPDGLNINKGCGAMAPELMQKTVMAEGADLGLALDGDADRVIFCDETGHLIDGDQLMGLIARYWRDSGQLRGGGVVATVMSNLALERFLATLDLVLLRTPVGDRYVVERMREGDYNVGGEQSGHVVLSDFTTTGDGLIAALQLLAVLATEGEKASRLTRVFDPLPQVLRNVRVAGGTVLENARVVDAIRSGETRLEGSGRLLIRKSGTEAVIRIMGEGEDQALVAAVVESIAEAITNTATAAE